MGQYESGEGSSCYYFNMKSITEYITDSMRGIKRNDFVGFSIPKKDKMEYGLDSVAAAISEFINDSNNRISRFEKQLKTSKSLYKTLDFLYDEDDDDFYRLWRGVRVKLFGLLQLDPDKSTQYSIEEIQKFIKDNDRELTKLFI